MKMFYYISDMRGHLMRPFWFVSFFFLLFLMINNKIMDNYLLYKFEYFLFNFRKLIFFLIYSLLLTYVKNTKRGLTYANNERRRPR